MTEFQCSCHIEGKDYELLTCGATTPMWAICQFINYLQTLDKEFDHLDGLVIDRVEVDR